MPFIDSKITVKVSDEKKEVLKAKIGKAVSIIGKPESFLMVGFEDEYTLYFAGNKLPYRYIFLKMRLKIIQILLIKKKRGTWYSW